MSDDSSVPQWLASLIVIVAGGLIVGYTLYRVGWNAPRQTGAVPAESAAPQPRRHPSGHGVASPGSSRVGLLGAVPATGSSASVSSQGATPSSGVPSTVSGHFRGVFILYWSGGPGYEAGSQIDAANVGVAVGDRGRLVLMVDNQRVSGSLSGASIEGNLSSGHLLFRRPTQEGVTWDATLSADGRQITGTMSMPARNLNVAWYGQEH